MLPSSAQIVPVRRYPNVPALKPLVPQKCLQVSWPQQRHLPLGFKAITNWRNKMTGKVILTAKRNENAEYFSPNNKRTSWKGGSDNKDICLHLSGSIWRQSLDLLQHKWRFGSKIIGEYIDFELFRSLCRYKLFIRNVVLYRPLAKTSMTCIVH